jgi:type VI secretion system secreted protein Hcp
MALNCYMRLTGETQGEIKGSVTQSGREDSIMIIGFAHEVVSPRDAASGLPTGKRQHKPITVTKEIDKSTPLLMNVLTYNENVKDWELRFWQPSPSGKEVQFYTIQLVNASVAGIRSEMLNNKYPENMQHKEREHISFCYQKVIWTFEDGGITAEDDWETPNA